MRRVLVRLAALTASVALVIAALSCGSSGLPSDAVPLISTRDLPRAHPNEIHLFAFNDFHGALAPAAGSTGMIAGWPAGGANYFATHLARLRAAYRDSALLAAGDNIGASALVSSLFHDEPAIKFLNSVGLSATSVGNHEFDRGVTELERLQTGSGCAFDGCVPGEPFRGATFPFLAANLTNAQGQHLPALRPWKILEVAGRKLGIIGTTTTDTANLVLPEGIRGLSFGDQAAAINKYVPEMQRAGAQAIIALMHDGGMPQQSLGKPVNYNGCDKAGDHLVSLANKIDAAVKVMITGHTHQPYVCSLSGKTVTQAASHGRILTDITLRFTGAGVTSSAVNRVVTHDVEPDAAASALVDYYTQQALPRANRVVGRIAGDLTNATSPAGDSAAGNLMAHAMLAAASPPDRGQAVAAVMNAGGVRAGLSSKAPPDARGLRKRDGEVTFGELYEMAPFGNQVVTVTLTGQQILSLLEQQWDNVSKSSVFSAAGLAYTYSDSAPLGRKVAAGSVRIGGRELNPVARYRIATNNFVASGGDGFSVFRQSRDLTVGPIDVDTLQAYFRSSPVVQVPASLIQRTP